MKKVTLIKFLESLKSDEKLCLYKKVDILFKIANDYVDHEILWQIVTDDEINCLVKQIADCDSWESLAVFFCDVKLLNQPYYYLNGCQNLENLSLRQFNNIIDDFVEEIKDKKLEDVMVEKEI